jgi:hypothetical protein
MHAHLRIARPTDRLHEVVAFYRDILGFTELGAFEDHDGFDGVMLGHAGAQYHLELTSKRGHHVGRAPTEDHLLVFYVEESEWLATTAQIEAKGVAPVPSFNPYWDRHGKTYEDPDGYRVVIHRGGWM